MTSATERLRALLDERGVEWRSGLPTETMVGEPIDVLYVERPDGRMHVYFRSYMTPEQAVAATLGRGTCRIDVFDNLAESDGNGDVWLECSACHWQMDYAEAPSMPLNYCPNCGRKVVDA